MTSTHGLAVDGDEVRRRRIELRMTQAELALELKMSPSAVSRLECGNRRVSVVSLRRIEAVLGELPVIDNGPSRRRVRVAS